MRRITHRIATMLAAICIVAASAPAHADTGLPDAGTTDSGSADVGSTDAGVTDAGVTDAGPADAGTPDGGITDGGPTDATMMDVSTDDMAPGGDAELDVGLDSGVDATSDAADGGVDTGEDVGTDLGPLDVGGDGGEAGISFSGTVILQFEPNGVGTEIVLEEADAEEPLTLRTFVESGNRFSFEDVPRGDYLVTVAFPGYVSVTEEISLDRDRFREYRLFLDQSLDVSFVVAFADAEGRRVTSGLPDEVEFVLESSRGTIAYDGREGGAGDALSVENATATLEETLGVGTWNLRATADGYPTTSYRFTVPRFESDEPAPLEISVLLRPHAEADVTVESGCSFVGVESGASGALVMLLGLLAALGLRRRSSRS